MDNSKLGVAIVGYGGMGKWHTKTIAKIDEAELIGIYDIDPARGLEAQENGIRAFSSLEELLDTPGIDVVTVAIPNDCHLSTACQIMDRGIGVVVEKPVALSSAEVEELMRCSKKNGVLFTVHQNRRWDEDYLVTKKLYDENTLGPIFNIESRVHGSRGIPGDWRNRKAQGGGMVLDWGVHLLDQMDQMMGDRKLISVCAQLSNVTNEEVDDGFRAIFLYESGLNYLVEVGTSNFINLPRWYVQGENGSAVVQDWERNGEIVMVSDWERRDAVPVVTAAGLTKTMAPRTEETIERFPLPDLSADIRDYYQNIRAVIKDGAEPIVKQEEVLRVMKIMEAIFRSAEENQVVKF
ncbi:MAG: Gfo/Idh/MocA family protein [Oscillospiraceae bacterium]